MVVVTTKQLVAAVAILPFVYPRFLKEWDGEIGRVIEITE